MRTIQYAIYLSMLLLISCNNTDDISEIFAGSWRISGATINNQSLNGDDITELYAEENTYKIVFSSGVFNGILCSQSNIGGTYQANGKDKTIVFAFSTSSNAEANTISRLLFNILKKASYYKGDANNINIYQDNYNYIRLTRL